MLKQAIFFHQCDATRHGDFHAAHEDLGEGGSHAGRGGGEAGMAIQERRHPREGQLRRCYLGL